MNRHIRFITSTVVGAALTLGALAGCSNSPSPEETASTTSPPPTSESAAPKKVLLVVSFGTSYNDNRELSIGGVEKAIADANPDYEIRRAFTSQIIIDKLAGEGIKIDNVAQAMDRLVADGVKDLVIQPTTIMAGFEYSDLVSEATGYRDKFDSFVIGSPLLTTDDDFLAVAKAITSHTSQYVADDTAIIFMGHGTDAPSNADYAKLGGVLTDQGYKNYFVGTVEGEPTLEDMIQAAKDANVKKVVLEPLMVVAGDHANNDMAGDEEDSWKTQFTAAGFEVTTLIEGLGQNPDIQKIYVEHAKAAIEQAGSGSSAEESDSAAEPSANSTTEIETKTIADGTYPINTTTGSSMFKIVDAQLAIVDEHATVTITLSGDGYGRLFYGTAAQAEKATSGFIEFTTDDQNRHVYVIPVHSMNKVVSIAAESGKTPGKFYDETVTFLSDKIPADAFIDD